MSFDEYMDDKSPASQNNFTFNFTNAENRVRKEKTANVGPLSPNNLVFSQVFQFQIAPKVFQQFYHNKTYQQNIDLLTNSLQQQLTNKQTENEIMQNRFEIEKMQTDKQIQFLLKREKVLNAQLKKYKDQKISFDESGIVELNQTIDKLKESMKEYQIGEGKLKGQIKLLQFQNRQFKKGQDGHQQEFDDRLLKFKRENALLTTQVAELRRRTTIQHNLNNEIKMKQTKQIQATNRRIAALESPQLKRNFSSLNSDFTPGQYQSRNKSLSKVSLVSIQNARNFINKTQQILSQKQIPIKSNPEKESNLAYITQSKFGEQTQDAQLQIQF